MNRSMFAVLFAVLCTPLAHAQDAQKPAAPPAAPAAPAAEVQKPRPVGQPADPQIIEKMFNCLAPGLPKDWKKAWFVITETDRNEDGTSRNYEANFFFATSMNDSKGKKLLNCGADPVLEGVRSLQDYLPESQLRWTGATFTFSREAEGVKFGATYDYTPRKPAPAAAEPAKPAAKAKASKKSDSTSK
jgi:hypothetical protein